MNLSLRSNTGSPADSSLDKRLRRYLASSAGITAALATQVEAAVVSSSTIQTFGINEEVNLDFNQDGQIDFQIDHDRYDLGGTVLDYLQVDKNDVNGASPGENPLPIGNFTTFPTNGTNVNGDTQYLAFTNSFNDQGGYAVGLRAGDLIGASGANSLLPGTLWDFQEGTGFLGSDTIRANRLIDEDAGQIDQALSSVTVSIPLGPQPEFPLLDDFVGNAGETRYLGVRLDLNDAGKAGLNDANKPEQWWYGWIGIRIDNDADATGAVTGWGYNTTPGMSITAGELGTPVGQPGDFNGDGQVDGADFLVWQRGGSPNPLAGADLTLWQTNYGAGGGLLTAAATAVPEPGSLLISVIGGCCLVGGFAARRLFSGRRTSL